MKRNVANNSITNDGKSKKKENYLDREKLIKDLTSICLCKEEVCVDSFTIHQILTARNHYHSKNEVEKMNWLISLLQHFYNVDQDTMSFQVLSRYVCRIGFLTFHGITKYKYYSALKKLKNGVTFVVHGNSDAEYKRTLHDMCYNFLNLYQTKYADVQPDTEEFHLPRHILKVDLYSAFLEHLQNTPYEIQPSYTTFRRVWEKDFPNLKIPKRTRLGKCDICANLSNMSLRLTAENRVMWSNRKREHLKFQRDERNENTKRINFANTYPNLITLLGIDRMNAIRMPWQVPFPKSW